MTDGEQKCTRCGFACDKADAPLYFNKRYGRARGEWESHCKRCRNKERADREARKRADPAHIAAKNERNRASYQRRREDVLAKLAAKRAAKVDRSNANRPARPNKSAREPVGVRPVVALDQALRDLEAALRLHIVEMNERDETLVKYLHVTRAIWARIAPESIVKGA